MAVDEHSHRVFVLDQGSCCTQAAGGTLATTFSPGTLIVLDARQGRVVGTVTVGGMPYALLVDELANHVLVLNEGYGDVAAPQVLRPQPAREPQWRDWRRWIPWLQPRATPTPDIQHPTVDVLDAS